MRLQSKQIVEIRGKKIGTEVPLICLPIVVKKKVHLLQQAQELMPFAPDLIEWRIDGIEHLEDIDLCLQTLADLRTKIETIPLILT